MENLPELKAAFERYKAYDLEREACGDFSEGKVYDNAWDLVNDQERLANAFLDLVKEQPDLAQRIAR